MTSATSCSMGLLAALAAISLHPCLAQSIQWTDWTNWTFGRPGSAVGTIGGVSVSYVGEATGAQTSTGTLYWLPASSFGGSNAPATPDIIQLVGNYTGANVITFSQPVRDPAVALLSIGSSTTPVDYTFNQPFTILAGGPNSTWGGASITNPSGNIVRGMEGNGVIQFFGMYTSIQWTVSQPEIWQGFTVGILGSAPVASYTTAGGPCVGLGGTPVLAARNTPRIGTTFTIDITGLSAYALPLLVTGFSSTVWAGGALPSPITQFGPPNCDLLVSPDGVLFLAASGGAATLQQALPMAPGLLGITFHNQCVAPAVQGSTLGISASGRGDGMIGP